MIWIKRGDLEESINPNYILRVDERDGSVIIVIDTLGAPEEIVIETTLDEFIEKTNLPKAGLIPVETVVGRLVINTNMTLMVEQGVDGIGTVIQLGGHSEMIVVLHEDFNEFAQRAGYLQSDLIELTRRDDASPLLVNKQYIKSVTREVEGALVVVQNNNGKQCEIHISEQYCTVVYRAL